MNLTRIPGTALAGCGSVLLGASALAAATKPTPEAPAYYRPELAAPETLQPFLKFVAPGNDAFPDEAEVAEIGARLAELSRKLEAHGGRQAGRALARRTSGSTRVPSTRSSAGCSNHLALAPAPTRET